MMTIFERFDILLSHDVAGSMLFLEKLPRE